MLPLSGTFEPPLIKAVVVHPENPLIFDFIVDRGDTGLTGSALEDESRKLIKYFLASLTTPAEDMWVNLSPYEKDRIIPESFGQTEMGRDLLAQDYLLKQLTASLIYPEDDLGKKFWDRVYKEARARFGTTDIPVNTFNKVWIMPDKAVIFRNKNTAFVVESTLKVMLEQDYVSLQKNRGNARFAIRGMEKEKADHVSALSSAVVRDIVLPAIEEEVNHGKNFAQLRQVYHSLILAAWYKKALKESFLSRLYVDQNKIVGVDVSDKEIKEKIYRQYLQAFQKGVFNFIREEFDPAADEAIPRKYFSGGTEMAVEPEEVDRTSISRKQRGEVFTTLDNPEDNFDLRVALKQGVPAAAPAGDEAMLAETEVRAFSGMSESERASFLRRVVEKGLVEQAVVDGWAADLQQGGSDLLAAYEGEDIVGFYRVVYPGGRRSVAAEDGGIYLPSDSREQEIEELLVREMLVFLQERGSWTFAATFDAFERERKNVFVRLAGPALEKPKGKKFMIRIPKLSDIPIEVRPFSELSPVEQHVVRTWAVEKGGLTETLLIRIGKRKAPLTLWWHFRVCGLPDIMESLMCRIPRGKRPWGGEWWLPPNTRDSGLKACWCGR